MACFLDACPHRTVPLSYGKVVNDRLQCGYHGWEFDLEGRCRRVPSLTGDPDSPARCATRFPGAIRSEGELVEALRAGDFEGMTWTSTSSERSS